MTDSAAKGRSHVDLIAAILAGFIGLLALAVSGYGVLLQREQVRAQVWPRLQFSQVWSGDLRGLRVTNAGVGPALVKWARIRVGDKPCKSWREVIAAVGAPAETPVTHSYLHDRVVPAGAEIHLLDLAPGAAFTWEQLARIDVSLCYCSVLDECWETVGVHVVSRSRCAPVDVPFEE